MPLAFLGLGEEVRTRADYRWDETMRQSPGFLLLQITLDGMGVFGRTTATEREVPPGTAFLVWIPSRHCYRFDPARARHWHFVWAITGSTTRPVTVQAGGTLSAGVTGAGKLSTGNLNLLASTSIFVEIGGATASQIDQIEVTGSVTLGGNVTISLINGYRPDPSLYGLPGFIPGGANIALPKFFAILNDGTDAIVGQFANQVSSANLFNGTPLVSFDGVTYAISYTGNSATNSFTGGNDLVFLAVPEPSSTLAILTGGLLFFSTRLRRNRRWR